MKYKRLLDDKLENHFDRHPKQALVLLGARQVGKTTILKRLFPEAKYLLVDEVGVHKILESYSSAVYRQLIGGAKRIFIDELHLLSNPGRAVKLIYDQIPEVEIIVSGSSSLHIKNKIAESMAGRAIDYFLYPLTYSEYLYQTNINDRMDYVISSKLLSGDESNSVATYDIESLVEAMLLYGQYPYLIRNPRDKLYLKNMIDKAVFKDIVALNLIENRSEALRLLKLLAYQIGNVLSYSSLAKRLEISAPTVRRYIDIFEQSFIIYRLSPFMNNTGREISKLPKIYFWDLGLRNALVDNFNELELRLDKGTLFENFIVNELKKEFDYNDSGYRLRYWRLRSGQEVDVVLTKGDEVYGCEIKVGRGKVSTAFSNRYPKAKKRLISLDNFV
ncbi:hypothetical protein DRH14_00270 [Candidatus Shapirobacteria bacterium]|nr:MAG: hypothetical protein DRH14_00270 [Candidatus Shapirobacteria bacterium]